MEDCLEKLELDNNVEWSIGLSLLREFEPSLHPGSEDCDFFSSLAHHIGDEATHSIANMSNFQDDMDLSCQAFHLSDDCKAQGKYLNYKRFSASGLGLGLTAESETSSNCSERFAKYCPTYVPILKSEDMKPGEVAAHIDSRHERRPRDIAKKERTGGTPNPVIRRKASHHARTILMDWIYVHKGK